MTACSAQLQKTWKAVMREKENVAKAIGVLKDIDCEEDATMVLANVQPLQQKLDQLDAMVQTVLQQTFGDESRQSPTFAQDTNSFCIGVHVQLEKVHTGLRNNLREAVEAGEVCKMRRSLPQPSDTSVGECPNIVQFWDNKLRQQLLRLVQAAPDSAKSYVNVLLDAQRQLNRAVERSKASGAECEQISTFLRGPFRQYVHGLLTAEGARRVAT